MAALRDIQNKIAAVKKTRQITRAMNMVAAARLRQVQERTERFRPYADKFSEVLGSSERGHRPEAHPLLAQPETGGPGGPDPHHRRPRALRLVQHEPDPGKAQKFLTEQKSEGREVVSFYAVGRRGIDFFKRRKVEFAEQLPGAMNVVDFDLATQVARLGLNAFLSGEVQEVYMLYSRFQSMCPRCPRWKSSCPSPPRRRATRRGGPPRSTSPSPRPRRSWWTCCPATSTCGSTAACLETSTSENAARMAAMDNATKNCKDLIQNLTLAFNKARQAAITAELMDIVGGAEALKPVRVLVSI